MTFSDAYTREDNSLEPDAGSVRYSSVYTGQEINGRFPPLGT